MKQITVKRHYLGETYTIGKLFIDNIYICDTLEDKVRDYNKDGDLLDPGEEKVYKETAIPYGTYKVVHNSSPKFPNTFWIQNVKHFTEILIHGGSTKEHTWGCILVGYNTIKGRLTDSKKAMDKIREILKNEKEITIKII